MQAKKRIFGLATLLILSFILTISSTTSDARKYTRDADLRKREQMVVISRELGVTCAHCHDLKNLSSGRKKTFKVALAHIRITKMLNGKAGFNKRPKVTCYLCHRGKARPDFREPKLK